MTTYSKNDPTSIKKMFGDIAKRYDRTNAVLSFQMHKRWNTKLVKAVRGEDPSRILLDLCCGTGEIAFDYFDKLTVPSTGYLVDFCPEMLEVAREKGKQYQQHKISYIVADAQEIPLLERSVGCVTIAYGIRNVQSPARCISEVYRVLQPGGCFGILELTQPNNRVMRFGHTFYLKQILPRIGKLVTHNQDAYQYLCNSIQSFVEPEYIEQLLRDNGFINTQIIPLSGGIATLILSQK